MASGCLDPPRKREARDSADGSVDAVPVEAATLPRRDSGAVAPRGVRVGVRLSLRPAVVDVPLAVGVGGHVRGVNRNLIAHVRVVVAEARGERVDASGDPVAFFAELRGEAVAGPMRGSAAEGGREARMFRDQVSYARPRRKRVQRLDETRAEHRPAAVPTATRPTKRIKLRN